MTRDFPSQAERHSVLRRTVIDIARRRQRPGTGSAPAPLASRSVRMRWPDLSDVLGGLPWAVVGAAATRLYMPERSTRDLDVVVLKKDAAAARRRLRTAGYQYRGELAIGGS